MGRRGLVMATLLLAGCIPSSEPRRAEPSRGEPRAARSDPTTRQCLADLARDGIEFEILPDRRFGGGCSAIGAVQLLDIGTTTANPGALTCPLAREYARWTPPAGLPAAPNWPGHNGSCAGGDERV